VIIRVFRPTIYPGKESEFESFLRAFAGERWEDAVIAPDEEHLLKDTWIAHYEVLPKSARSVKRTHEAACPANHPSRACRGAVTRQDAGI
jgi:hypothetical protein